MQIRSITLYSKNGESASWTSGSASSTSSPAPPKTGKSALLDIVDFCLGRDEATLPISPIFNTVAWYAVILQLPDTRSQSAPGRLLSDALELLIKAPTPAAGAKLTRTQITAVLARHRRHHRDAKANTVRTALREKQLGLPEPVTDAYAATHRPRTSDHRVERTDSHAGSAGEGTFSRAPRR
ncbi:hypothetical protein ACWEKM_04730 [Streptomyces sp. NPDC004752]